MIKCFTSSGCKWKSDNYYMYIHQYGELNP